MREESSIFRRPAEVLLLCTANQCRSPMAEVLLRHHLESAGVVATVSSAGLLRGGRPATRNGVAVMADRGLDLGGHRSRKLGVALVRGADLIIGMGREHVREVAILDPGAIDRCYTLKELVSVAGVKGARRFDEPLGDWLTRLAVGRRLGDLAGLAHDDMYDIEDPIGRGLQDYEATAAELDGLLARLVELAWPATTAH